MLKEFIQFCQNHPTFAFGLMTATLGAAVGLSSEVGRIPGGIALIAGISFSLLGLIESPTHPNSSQK